MDNKYDEFVGVDKLHAALILEDSEANYTAEAPEYLAPSAEITNDTETDIQTTYYDNVPANNYVSEGATTVQMTVSGVPANKAAKYLGKHYDVASGRIIDTGDPNPPDVALSFRYDKGKNGFRYYQYLKGKFSGGTEEAATKGSSIDIKTYQITFTAAVTTKKWLIDGEMKGVKRIIADTVDEAFNADNWFNQVQTPDTADAPTVFSFDSSTPADEATAVAVDSNIVLNFSNKVLNYSMTLYTDAFIPVDVEITANSTGKVLTIDPVAGLTGATSYVLIIAEVTDVFGQKLNNLVIGFTTA